ISAAPTCGILSHCPLSGAKPNPSAPITAPGCTPHRAPKVTSSNTVTRATSRLPTPLVTRLPSTHPGPTTASAPILQSSPITALAPTSAEALTSALAATTAPAATPGTAFGGGCRNVAIRAYVRYGCGCTRQGTGLAA